MGCLEYLFPWEYVSTFKVFHSEAPETPLHRMKVVIQEELGRPGMLTCKYVQEIVPYVTLSFN